MNGEKREMPSSPKELYELLLLASPAKQLELDTSTLRYAIYARKSTSGDERQERSIPDQISDCIDKVVKPEGLKIIGKPIEEKCSAKDPDIRPEFRRLLEDVRSGRIDGIVSWHPDRLSRNMKEAGEIIDLLDKGVLKDLRFATSTFENSPTGKMLLGISFVLSKQYSEHLSESVTRGNRRKIEGGHYFDEMKHGYFIKDGRLFPEQSGNSFLLIKEAFQKRLSGMPQTEIANWLNTTSYVLRKKNKDPAKYVWNKQNVSKMLRDPTYAGVLKYGSHLSNLEDYYDFEPVVTVEEFLKINKVKDLASPKIVSAIMSNKRESTKANLLRGVVSCGFCGKSFSSGLTRKERKSGTIYYYFYKCETDGCEFRGKSVRAKVVLEYAFNFLSDHLFTTKSNYSSFLLDAKQYHKEQLSILNSKINGLVRIIGTKNEEYKRAKEFILANPELKDHYSLNDITAELKSFEAEKNTAVEQRNNLKDSVLTYEQYLELFRSVGDKLAETDDMGLLDQILRKFFSNFTIKAFGSGKKQRYEIIHKLNEPWEGFVKSNNFVRGRG